MAATKKRAPTAAARKGASPPTRAKRATAPRVKKSVSPATEQAKQPCIKINIKLKKTTSHAAKLAIPPTREDFPISNVRGCPESPPALPKFKPVTNPINLKGLKLAPDHLTMLPNIGYRYLSVQGRRLYDRRYDVKVPREPQPKHGRGKTGQGKKGQGEKHPAPEPGLEA